jgi:hydrogenase-4 component F
MDGLIIYYSSVFLLCGLMYFIKSKFIQHALFIPFLSMQGWLTVFCFQHVGQVIDEYFRIDRLSVIFITVITILAFTTILHSLFFATRRNETYKMIALHNGALMILISMMSGVLISGHLALLCAFVEATALASAILIYRDRSKEKFEAAWKYFSVCSIGIALAFVGILLIVIAGQEINNPDINMTTLIKGIASMNPLWLKIAFIFVLTGFSVKIGVAPLFTVGIDAIDAAPLHVGALFSGGITIVGFVAIFRFYEIFSISPELNHWMNTVLLITGMISILLATVYTLKINNYRRMLAYSSMEHAGIILIALSLGHLGHIAAILHLICHSFIKASLFYQFGNIYWFYRTDDSSHLGNYFKNDLTGGMVVLLEFFMILAMPPSGLFISEFLLIKSLFIKGDWFVLFPMLSLLAFLFANLSRRFLDLLFMPAKEERVTRTLVNTYEAIPQIILLLLVIWIGIDPPFEMIKYIEDAVMHLPR